MDKKSFITRLTTNANAMRLRVAIEDHDFDPEQRRCSRCKMDWKTYLDGIGNTDASVLACVPAEELPFAEEIYESEVRDPEGVPTPRQAPR
jgi:hypothetical protein